MKLILATVAFITSAVPAIAQELPVRLKDGASWTITGEHSQAGEGMGPSHNWTVITTKRLTFHRAANGALATLTVTPLSALPGPNSPPEVAQARSLAIPATLYAGDDLAPGAVLNPEVARAEVAKLITSRTPDPAVLDLAARAMIASELGIASRAQGLAFRKGATLSAEVELPNPIGGIPMGGKQTATLEQLDDKTGQAVIHWRQTMNPDALKESSVAMLARMANDKAPKEKIDAFRSALEGANILSETDCRHQIDLRTGLAVKVECTTSMTVTMHGKTQATIEHWLITQSLPEAA